MRFLAIGECMVEMSNAGAEVGGGLWRQGFAGDTLNTAWYMRALLPAAWSVDYYTAVGTDPLSDAMLRFMEDAGIGTTLIAREADRVPGLYMISLDKGERSFTYWRDRSAARTLARDPQRLAEALAQADVIYVSGITMAVLEGEGRATMLQALQGARDAGKRIVFDPNLRPRLWTDAATMCAAIEEAAALAHIVLPSHDDEARFFGDASPEATARRYAALGVGEVMVKNGGGAMAQVTDGGAPQALPGLPPVEAVDTTGAGDSFNAGYLAARLTGAEAAEAVRQGHDLASRVVRHHGALLPAEALRP